MAVTTAQLYAYYQNPKGIVLSPWSPKRMDSLEAINQQIQFAHQFGYERFLRYEVLNYLNNSWNQLSLADRANRPIIRKGMRRMLNLGRKWECLPRLGTILFFYEAAYPCRPLWWFIHHL